MNPSSFTLYICLWDVYDAVLIKNFQVNPKPFVCLTARFKRDLCGWRAKLCDWKMMTEFVLDLASCMTGCVYTVRVTQLMRGTQLYRDWTLDTTHFYCPPVTLKWKSDDLIFCLISQAARRCTRPSARLAQCVAASWWEGHSRFEDWTQHALIAPFWCVVPRVCHEW